MMRPAWLLIRNHLYELRHAVQHVHEQPSLKVAVIGTFMVSWLLGLSWLFYEAFDFMYRLGGVAFYLIPRMFTLFFMGLGFMLMLSGAVSGYGNLYQSAETRRLLTWPVPMRDLFYFKTLQTMLMSSWAFFFIIVPFIGSFGVYRQWPLTMVFWAVAYSLPFVMIFSGLGILVMLLFQGLLSLLSRVLGRWRNRFLWLMAFLALVRMVFGALAYLEQLREQRSEEFVVMVRMVPGLGLASNPLLPNWWMAQGVLGMAAGDTGRALLFLTLLVSSVGVLCLVVAGAGGWLYPASMQRHLTAASDLATRASRLSQAAQWCLSGGGAVRAYLFKDFLIFLRDPSQWTQFLIFFGLLGLYFFNLGSLGYDQLDTTWANLISFLNMFSLSAVMSSLSSRFVYPQLSQEGRMLWMVGLAPQSLSKMMMIKFLLAGGSLVAISLSLSAISNGMLNIPEFSQRLTLVLMPSVSLALAGMATGLGAVFMDIEAKTPTQILSGYGGTLNLILTLLTVILLVLVPGIVAHMMTVGALSGGLARFAFPATALYIVIVSLIAGGLPLWIGHRTLVNRDF
jgi:ABC-2 type transport system permease protein